MEQAGTEIMVFEAKEGMVNLRGYAGSGLEFHFNPPIPLVVGRTYEVTTQPCGNIEVKTLCDDGWKVLVDYQVPE